MRLKIWFTAAGLSVLALVVAVPLSRATSRLCQPQFAQAAKVTATLLKSKAMHPVTIARRSRALNRLEQPTIAPTPSERLVSYPLTRRLPLNYLPKQAPRSRSVQAPAIPPMGQ